MRRIIVHAISMAVLTAVTIAGEPWQLVSEATSIPNTQKAQGGGVLPLKNGVQLDLAKPFPLREGTLSAWVRPMNWSGETPEMVSLFRVHDTECWWRVFKYRIDANNYGLTFVFGLPSDQGERRHIYLTAPMRDWQRNEWHHIAVTWDANDSVIALYIDGERKGNVGVKEGQWPRGEPRTFEIASPNTKPDGDIFRTAFDLVELYDEALSDATIAELSQQRAGSEIAPLTSVPPSIATIPRISRSPLIDGVPAPGEWDSAAKLFGGLAIREPFIHPGRTFVIHAAYDEERLYLMMVSPTPTMQLRTETLENGNVNVALDDAVEVLLAPSGNPAHCYQLIGNSQGYHYTNHAGDRNWNGHWAFANTLYEGYWYAEFSIPFTSLGLKKAPEPGTRWKANFCRDWTTDSMAVFTSWSFTPDSYFSHMGEIVFGGADSGYALTVDAEALATGKVDGELRSLAPAPEQVRLQTEDGNGVLSNNIQDVSSSTPLTFSETLPPGRISSVLIASEGAGAAFRQPLPLRVESSMKLTTIPDLERRQLKITSTLGNTTGQDSLILKIRDDKGVILQETQVKPEASGKLDISVSTTEMPEGRYQLSLERAGEILVERAYDHMGNAEWREWQSDFKGVPRPWTPIAYADKSLGFWGRTYTLTTSPLPSGIQGLDRPLIRAPMALRIVADGKELPWEPTVKWTEKDAAQGGYTVSAEDSGWKITATVKFEFDGFWWVDLQCDPLRPDARLDELTLTIPFAPGVAKFVYAHNHSREYEQGEITADSLGRFYPHIWIGNDDVGLTWATESDEYWSVADPQQTARFHPDAAGGELRIQMVSKAISPKEPIRYGFGIQATPVRPFDTSHRSRRIAPTVGGVLAHPWTLDRSVKRYGDSDKEWGFLSPHYTSTDSVKTEIAKWREKGLEMPWYIAPDIISPQSTEFQVFRDEWKNPHAVYQFACVNSSFSQFTNREMETLVRDAGLRAIYVDCAKAYPCGNSEHGCGYRDASGKLHLTYPVRALREYLKNLYVTLHEKGGDDASLILHLSAGLTSIAHGFSDIVLEGEEVQYLIGKTPSYFDLFPPMKWRTIFGKAYGINTMLLPNYGRVGPKENRMSETLNATFMTQALLNDTAIWNLWTNEAYVNRIYSALDKAGWQAPDVKFEPYWSQSAVTIAGADLKASIYHTKKGALIAIGNFEKQPLSGRLSVDLQKLGLGAKHAVVTDVLTGRTLPPDGADLTVAPENFTLLLVQENPERNP